MKLRDLCVGREKSRLIPGCAQASTRRETRKARLVDPREETTHKQKSNEQADLFASSREQLLGLGSNHHAPGSSPPEPGIMAAVSRIHEMMR